MIRVQIKQSINTGDMLVIDKWFGEHHKSWIADDVLEVHKAHFEALVILLEVLNLKGKRV